MIIHQGISYQYHEITRVAERQSLLSYSALPEVYSYLVPIAVSSTSPFTLTFQAVCSWHFLAPTGRYPASCQELTFWDSRDSNSLNGTKYIILLCNQTHNLSCGAQADPMYLHPYQSQPCALYI